MTKTLQLLLILFAVAVLSLLILNYPGCRPAIDAGDAIYQKIKEGDGCKPATSGCGIGNALYLCNGNHVWEVNTDCDDYETPRQCCRIGGTFGCHKPYECKGEKQ